MLPDTRIKANVEAIVRSVEAPSVPWPDIQRRIQQPQANERRAPIYARFAMAAAVVVIAIFLASPSRSLALIQNIEARYRAALQALGGYAPPPAPASFVSSLSPEGATLTTAQSRVSFTIVSPAGLPKGIISKKIETTPKGIYSRETRSWRVGSQIVTFAYRRAGGRVFVLIADRFDPRTGLPAKYLFEARNPAPDGRPVIVRRENFAWRNGSQIMSVAEGDGISASEIRAIRVAMHGTALSLPESRDRKFGGSFIRLPAP